MKSGVKVLSSNWYFHMDRGWQRGIEHYLLESPIWGPTQIWVISAWSKGWGDKSIGRSLILL